MGKIMSFVFTLSLCAQPLGQLLYGVLFDTFSQAPWCVLLPTGWRYGPQACCPGDSSAG